MSPESDYDEVWSKLHLNQVKILYQERQRLPGVRWQPSCTRAQRENPHAAPDSTGPELLCPAGFVAGIPSPAATGIHILRIGIAAHITTRLGVLGVGIRTHASTATAL